MILRCASNENTHARRAHPIATLILVGVMAGLAPTGLVRAAESPVSVTASVNPSQIKIGDLLSYELTLTWPVDYPAPVVEPGRALGDFEIVNANTGQPEDTGDGRRQQVHRFEMTAYDTGDLEIPSLPIDWRDGDGQTTGVVQTAPIQVRVTGVDDSDTAEDIRSAKAPVDLTQPFPWLLTTLIAAGIVLLIAFILWRRRRARLQPEARPEPPRPIDEVALEALEELGRRLPTTYDEAMVFYVRLTEILRVFLGRRYGFDAMDRTTSEIHTILSGRITARADVDAIHEFLNIADLVKFAKHPADRDQALNALDTARHFVHAHKPPMETRTA